MKLLIKTAFTLLLIASLNNSCNEDDLKGKLNKEYCYDDDYQELKVQFDSNADTIFLYYINILESGNYINGYADLKDDYAGFFTENQVENGKVLLKLKNYRTPQTQYDLTLEFDSKSLKWNIQNQNVSYLPNEANLSYCKSK